MAVGDVLLLARFPEAGGVLVLFALFAGLAIGLRLLAAVADHSRIAEYIQSRGGRVISIEWSPFGKGWFGEKNDRIYEVIYYDADGNQHFATCKTSLFSGVYWTEDRIYHGKPAGFDQAREAAPAQEHPPLVREIEFVEQADLREENLRLKQQLASLQEELKRRQSG